MKKMPIAYSIIMLVNIGVDILLFFFLSIEPRRTSFFYYQLGFTLFLTVVFWGNLLASSIRGDSDQNANTRGVVSSNTIFLYVFIMAVVMIAYSVLTKSGPGDHRIYYSVLIIISFVFFITYFLSFIKIGTEGAKDAVKLNSRQNIRSLGDDLEESRALIQKIIRTRPNDAEKYKGYERSVSILISSLASKANPVGKGDVVESISGRISTLKSLLETDINTQASDAHEKIVESIDSLKLSVRKI